MRIAMLGTRGVPAAYSGFETCVEQIGKRLAARGHKVFVYSRAPWRKRSDSSYLGMNRIVLPNVRTKGLDTLSHTGISTVHALVRLRPDVALVFGVGNSVFAQALHLLGIPVAVNVDGADWKRKKWGSIGRRYLRWSESVAAHLADGLITDSVSMVGYYRLHYKADPVFIPYGAEIPSSIGNGTLARFGLEPRKYLLTVGRLVPENGIDNLIHAYKDSGCRWPLVVVGDAQYSVRYKRYLRDIAHFHWLPIR
jgi:glycosyltransferase involved in cell wall biosynthesis